MANHKIQKVIDNSEKVCRQHQAAIHALDALDKAFAKFAKDYRRVRPSASSPMSAITDADNNIQFAYDCLSQFVGAFEEALEELGDEVVLIH